MYKTLFLGFFRLYRDIYQYFQIMLTVLSPLDKIYLKFKRLVGAHDYIG